MNERDRSEAATRRIAVWKLLSDGQWHTTMDINAKDVGGSEGCRRLRELRAECRDGKRTGWLDIQCRRSLGDSTQWEYRALAVVLPKRAPTPAPAPSAWKRRRGSGWLGFGAVKIE